MSSKPTNSDEPEPRSTPANIVSEVKNLLVVDIDRIIKRNAEFNAEKAIAGKVESSLSSEATNVVPEPVRVITVNEDPTQETPILTPGQSPCFSTPLSALHHVRDVVIDENDELQEKIETPPQKKSSFHTPNEVVCAMKQEMPPTEKVSTVVTTLKTIESVENTVISSETKQQMPPTDKVDVVVSENDLLLKKLPPSGNLEEKPQNDLGNGDLVASEGDMSPAGRTIESVEMLDKAVVVVVGVPANSLPIAVNNSVPVDKPMESLESSVVSSDVSADKPEMPEVASDLSEKETRSRLHVELTHPAANESSTTGVVSHPVDKTDHKDGPAEHNGLNVQQLVEEVNIDRVQLEEARENPANEHAVPENAEPKRPVPVEQDVFRPLILKNCEAVGEHRPRALEQRLRNFNYRPLPVQEKIELVLTANRSILVQAEFGTGKTTACALVLVKEAMRRNQSHNGRGPVAVMIMPSHEGCRQVYDMVHDLAHDTGISYIEDYKGVDADRVRQYLRRGSDILICTSGKFLHHLQERHIDPRDVKLLILDEADRVIADDFTNKAVDFMFEDPHVKATLQIAIVMTTWNMAVDKFVKDFMNLSSLAQVYSLGGLSLLSQRIRIEVENLTGSARKKAWIEKLTRDDKSSRIVVFVNDQDSRIVNEPYHSNQAALGTFKRAGIDNIGMVVNIMSGYERNIALAKFQSGENRVLVISDACARGLSLKAVDHVIVYELPHIGTHPDPSYTFNDFLFHRLGKSDRSGRERTTIFFDDLKKDFYFARELVGILRCNRQEVPEWLHKKAYDDF